MTAHDASGELRRQFGAFARIFREDSAAALADRFAELDLRTMQFNFSALGYPALPGREEVERLDLAGIAASFATRSSTPLRFERPSFWRAAIRKASTHTCA